MKTLISKDKRYCFGKPRIAGTRITVSCIKNYYIGFGGGLTVNDIVKTYPNLTTEQVKAAINYCRRDKI